MTEAAYQQWRQLHIRAARGEMLNEVEQALYRAGMDDLDIDLPPAVELVKPLGVLRLRSNLRFSAQALAQNHADCA